MSDRGKYSNPDVPHEVNVSEKTPLRDFFRLTAGVCLITVCVVAAIFFSARWWAPAIPFHYETAFSRLFTEEKSAVVSPAEEESLQVLQTIADGLAAKMELPAGMAIRMYLIDTKEPNAFATLGGNVLISRALIETLHSENGLAMVIAHEIAHIKHRDPIVSLGGGVAVALLLSAFIAGADGGYLVSWAVGMTQMSFSRPQEDRADKEALAALKACYGHTGGADEFFAYVMKEYPWLSGIPGVFSSHPSPQARLDAIRATFSSAPQNLKPLPESLARLKNSDNST